MRILLVTLEAPFPLDSGYRLHFWYVLQALSQEGHETVLASFVGPGQDASILNPLRKCAERLELVPFAVNTYEKLNYLKLARGFFSTVPYSSLRYVSSDFAATLSRLLRSEHFDAIICDQVYAVVNLPSDVAPPVIADTFQVPYFLLRRYAQHFRNPLKRLYAWVEAEKTRRWEASMLGRLSALGVCSDLDGELFRRLYPAVRIVNIPNVVDTGQYKPDTVSEEQNRLLYCGAMNWYPNQDAVQFFAEAIFPELQKQVPDVRLVAAGRSPSESFRRRFAFLPEIEFTGTVPDMCPEFARAAVFVVPLRIASGTRLKILEAAAMARPIVSTRVGAEGLDFADGKEIVLADDPRDFAHAVADLLSDPERRRALGQAARRRVEKQYSLAALRAALGQALEEVTGRRASSCEVASARQLE
jgi:glycosyltransferase involved in cell wall biosynthesis